MAELQERINAREVDPRCPVCGGFLKAATILFGQRVPEAELARARTLIGECDLLLVVGSSLKVVPAATLPRLALQSNVPLIIVNLPLPPLVTSAEPVTHQKARLVLPTLAHIH